MNTKLMYFILLSLAFTFYKQDAYSSQFFSTKNEPSIVLNYNTPSNWNSFSQPDSLSLSLSQEAAVAKLVQFMQPTIMEQQWSHLAPELHRCDRYEVCKANAKSFFTTCDTLETLLGRCCPGRIDSPSFLYRSWDYVLDSLHGTRRTDSNPSVLRMTESIVALCTTSFTIPEIQSLFTELQINIKPLLWDTQGHIRTHLTPDQLRNYHAITEKFFQEVGKWCQHNLITQCATDALNSQNPYHNTLQYRIPIPEQYIKTNGPLAPAFADLTNKEAFRDLFELKNLCDHGNFEKAYAIAEKYAYDPELTRSINGKTCYKELYLKKFYEKYDQRGIKKEYLSDPFCQTFTNLPFSEKPSIYNTLLAERDGIKNTMMDNCDLYDVSEHTLKIMYDIVDQYKHNPNGIIDRLCSTLSADHPDQHKRSTYLDVSDQNGQLKIFGQINTYKMPSAINRAEFAAERALLNKLIVHHSNHPKLNQFIYCLQNACNNSVQAYPWRSFAHICGKAILEGKEHIVAIIPDFSIAVKPNQEPIKIECMDFWVKVNNPEIGSQDFKRLTHLSEAYNCAITGDYDSQKYLENALINGNYALLDTRINYEYHKAIEPAIKEAMKNKMLLVSEGYRELQQFVTFNELLNPTTKMHCIAHNIPYERYEKFEGNRLQFVIFKFDRENVEKAAELSAIKMNPTLRRVYEWGVQSNFLTHNFIKARHYVQAIDLSTLVYKTFYYVDKACNYADYVVTETLEGIADGFQEMPARLQGLARELLAQVQNNLQEFHSLHLSNQQNITTNYLENIKKYVQNPSSIGKDIWSCCKALTNKAMSFASNVYQMGPRKVAKNVTQCGIDAYLLRKAERIMQQGAQALSAEARRTQSPNYLTKPQNSERIIIDAEITQIEVTALAAEGKAMELAAIESAPISKVEQARASTQTSDKIKKLSCQLAAAEKTMGKNTSTPQLDLSNISKNASELLANYNPNLYDSKKVNIAILTESVKGLAHIKGALSKDGPLLKALELGKNNNLDSGTINTIRGAIYELETALKLTKKGENILEIGGKISRMHQDGKTIIKTYEIDIITQNSMVECKNWFWEKINMKSITDLKDQLKIIKKLSVQEMKNFEFHSKNSIPRDLKEWLINENIIFYEG